MWLNEINSKINVFFFVHLIPENIFWWNILHRFWSYILKKVHLNLSWQLLNLKENQYEIIFFWHAPTVNAENTI